ncbi:hypothetical protein BG003_008328 [Podila horticola]|nr:hypothetical protein BG003_008328 [Podila horticola]
MDPTANNDRNSQNGRDSDSKGKGKASSSDTNTSSLLGSIAGSAKSLASALDPTRPQSGHGAMSNVLGSANGGAKQQAAISSSASYQQATRALETLRSTSSSSTSGTSQQSGFRSVGPEAGGGMAMDWDNFLSSSESTVTDDKPYQPPSFSSLTDLSGSSLGESSRSIFATTSTEPAPVRSLPPLANDYQNHLSQPMNLTPANHAAFLEYLKSTATRSQPQTSGPSSSTTPTSAISPANQQPQPFQHQTPVYQPYTPVRSLVQPLFSRDVQFQQQQDGGDVLAFLNSTSYSDFVDEVESAGLEKHQHERRQFHYAPGMVSQPGLSHLMSLIQHLPSERQDIVQYLLQQGTYTDDVYSMPFGWDGRDEAASLQATLSEQDQFLRQQSRTESGEEEGGDDATTAEMERVLAEIVADAKTEVSTGQTQGRALDRLLMVRSHITMGTKL